MSEHDATPDPIDAAYVQAEALLDDEASRAARRARVLAAVARQPAAPEPPRASRGLFWGQGRWLAAASVAGIGLLVGLRFYQPAEPPPQAAPPSAAAGLTPAAPAASDSAPAVAASPPPPAAVVDSRSAGVPARLQAPAESLAKPQAPPTAAQDSRSMQDKAAPAPPLLAAPPPPPPQPPASPRLQARAEASAPPPAQGALAEADSGTSVEQVVVTGARARGTPQTAPLPIEAAPNFASKSMQELARVSPAEKAERLRAAAAAGRTSEITALLSQGAAVDDPDEAGDTALIKAVRAKRAAAAGLLRRRGADLDLKNNAGQSARDIAAALGDRTMNRVLGLRK